MPRVRIMAAGDSITMGSPEWRGGYRRPLNNRAPNLEFVGSRADVAADSCIGVGQHEGYSGATTATVRTNVLANAPTYSPLVVLWMTGTNDITNNTEDPLEIYNAALDVLALAAVEHVIVGNIPPRKTTQAQYQQTLDFRAAMDVQFAGPLPAGLYYCDPGGVIDDSTLYDSLHPNTAGYELMAPVWYEALVSTGVQLRQDHEGMVL